MNRIRPCPFCGASAKAEYATCDYNVWQVVCENNKCSGMCGWSDTEEEAIVAWNTRKPPANPPLTLDELTVMHGKRVWVESVSGSLKACWHTVNTENMTLVDAEGGYWTIDEAFIGERFTAYRHKPEREGEK